METLGFIFLVLLFHENYCGKNIFYLIYFFYDLSDAEY